MTTNIVPSIIKSYQGKSIRIREDKYVCLTDMATASGKLLGHWRELKGTNTYLEALSEAIGIAIPLLLEVTDGNPTWAHPRIGIKFAAWCSPQFEVQVTGWIDELMTTGSVSIAPQLQRQLPPQRDYIEHLQAAKEIALLDDPILKSYLLQACYEEIGATKVLPASSETLVLAAVKARSLGFSLKSGEDSKLGKWVAKHCNPAGKTQHGRYEVNVYRDDDRLVETIFAFFG